MLERGRLSYGRSDMIFFALDLGICDEVSTKWVTLFLVINSLHLNIGIPHWATRDVMCVEILLSHI